MTQPHAINSQMILIPFSSRGCALQTSPSSFGFNFFFYHPIFEWRACKTPCTGFARKKKKKYARTCGCMQKQTYTHRHTHGRTAVYVRTPTITLPNRELHSDYEQCELTKKQHSVSESFQEYSISFLFSHHHGFIAKAPAAVTRTVTINCAKNACL